MSEEIPPQFSPDGHYWWNGHEWVPTEQLPTPTAIPVPKDPFAERPRRWRTPLLIALGGLLAVLVAGTAVFGVTRLVGNHAQPRPSPAATASTAPTHTPAPTPTAAATPIPVSGTTIPGLSGTALLELARQQGLSCRGATPEGVAYRWHCSVARNQALYDLQFTGTDMEHLSSVLASAQADNPAGPTSFIRAVAGVSYQDAKEATARAWVDRHLEGGWEIFGPATFHTLHDGRNHIWVLQIYPHT